MNKGTIISIIVVIVIGIAVAIGFSISPENGENQASLENGEVLPEESSGRNLTIELEETISLQANP